ncbi:hypothetical protein GCM10011487_67520 [Steroidobacter agaridevorans]|uniref:DUF885 domain-containing protein n=1 Tax=Steroidobacter agaridevorans TaxID=2695856 RepID=A0A829YPM7_9GAMM|nr:DUF885 family protein [Steroidobacter agaridevorans]GFE84752.1 hypothetical protein GCM10011487_67520 [Steroidobacter agaridevorans]
MGFRSRPASVLSGLTLLLSCSLALAQSPEASLSALIDEYEQLIRKDDPVSAGQEGDREALRRLPDVRPETQQAIAKQLKGIGERLATIDVAGLSEDAALNHQLLTGVVAIHTEQLTFDLPRIPFENDSGFHTLLDYLARTTTIGSRDDAEAWIARLDAAPAYYEQNLANLKRGIKTKYTQPRIVADRVLEVARKQANTKAEDSSLLLPFARMPSSIPTPAQEEYRSKALALVRDRILPAQKEFAEFMEKEYLRAARPKLAWRTVPNGESSYKFFVRRETTTQMTPDEIHQLGQSEVARIRGLMEKTIAETGFKGSFADFLQMMRTDARFYAKTPEELMEKASEIAKRSDDQLPRLFGTLPRLPYGVRPVPADIAEGYTTGRYWVGSMQQGQAGGYMVNTSHLDQRPLYELPALTVHEAVPGHHLQIALSQELSGIPYFRRNTSPTAFVEGWGLYSEFLGEEMGIYRDPYERFGRYSYEMWRACRLVADTGIHWLGWDIEQVRRCFTENSALAPHNIQTELERYISWPGQALAYKIGELRFRGLRRDAEQALGENFNVRDFHDKLLLSGALPLDVVSKRIQAWIAEKSPAKANSTSALAP